MEEFTSGEVYQKKFDPRAYLEYFDLGSNNLGNEAVTFYLECFCKTFTPDGTLQSPNGEGLSMQDRYLLFVIQTRQRVFVIHNGYAGKRKQSMEEIHRSLDKPDCAAYDGRHSGSALSDVLKGDTLIDLGSGPCIYQFMSACESFENIIASDYVDRNLQEIEKWRKKEPGAFDWSSIGKYVCELEGNRAKWPEKEAKLRRAIKQVLKCDVNLQNPMAPLHLPLADCVLSTECLESACKDQASYRAAFRNISSLLKPGGHLVLSGLLETTLLVVGSQKFSILFLKEKFLRETVTESGFSIIQFKTQPRIDKETLDLCDFAALYFIIAQKVKA